MVEEPYKLLIVDSIMALFRCALANRQTTPLGLAGDHGHQVPVCWGCCKAL